MNYSPIELTRQEPLFRSHRLRARQTLAIPGLRLHVIVATLIFLTMWVGGLYMVENAWYALNWSAIYKQNEALYAFVDTLFYLTDGLFIVFGGLPLVYGYARYLVHSATGVLPPLSALFYAFGNRARYFRSLWLMIRLLLRYTLWLGIVVLSVFLAQAIQRAWGNALVYLLAPFIGVYTVVGSIGIGIGDAIFLLDINHPEYTVNEVFRASRIALRPQLLQTWLLKVTLIHHWLIGILSLGTLLLFHSLPYCLFTQQYAVWSILCEEPALTAPVDKSNSIEISRTESPC